INAGVVPGLIIATAPDRAAARKSSTLRTVPIATSIPTLASRLARSAGNPAGVRKVISISVKPASTRQRASGTASWTLPSAITGITTARRSRLSNMVIQPNDATRYRAAPADTVVLCVNEVVMLQRRFLVGTYTTQRASRGLYLCAMDPSGRIDVVDACEMADPSFVVLHPTLALAYVVNETPTGHSCVSAGGIRDRLEPRQRVDSEGELPCHLAVLDGGLGLAVAHY